MIVDNYYVLSIFLDGREVFSNERNFSFSTRESIYSIYNGGILTVKDLSSIIQESLIFNEGTILEIEYGLVGKTTNRCSFVVDRDTLEKVERVGSLVGDVDYGLKNSWFTQQQALSASYENRLDTLINTILNRYPSIGKDIFSDPSGTQSIFYQPMIDDASFIEKRVLPVAYSNNADGSAFYAFLTSDNVFHFKCGQAMFDENPKADYVYRVEPFDHKSNIDLSKIIIDLKKWKENLSVYNPSFYAKVFRIDRETGEILEEEDSTYLHHRNHSNEQVPIVWKNTNVQSYVDLNYTQNELGKSEQQKGYINFLNRKSNIVDRFLCLAPFNPDLHAGDTVNLTISVPIGTDNTPSNYYSDKYLIEDLEHIWNSAERRGYTKMILGRKFVKIDSDKYTVAAKYVKGV